MKKNNIVNKGARAIIVEDEKIIALDISEMLGRLGFNVVGCFASGEEAINELMGSKADIILMDIFLKGKMDGIESAQVIDEKFGIPVIFVTAHQDLRTVERSKFSNPYGFLAKPVEERDLEICLKNALYRKDSEKKLKEMQEKYFRLTENAKDMIFRYLIKEKKFEYVNRAASQITGCEPSYFYDNPAACLKFLVSGNDEREQVKLLSSGGEFEYEILDDNGRRKWLNCSSVIVKNKKGEPEAVEGIIKDISERKEYELMLKDANLRLHHLADHIESVREDERRNISREIHDQLGTDITVLKVELYLLAQKITDPDHILDKHEIESNFSKLSVMINLIVEKIRDIASKMRPDVLDRLGLSEAVEWLLDENRKRTGISGTIDSDIPGDDLPGIVAINMFRIIQELITNTVRHAGASGISVSMHMIEDELVFSYEDDGAGIKESDINNSSSYGILGMKERVRLMNGSIDIHGAAGSGTRVIIRIPQKTEVYENGKTVNC